MFFADVTPRPEYEPFRVIGVAKVAKSLGVSTSHLYNVLSGISNPSESLEQEIKAAAEAAKKLLHQIEAARVETNQIWERVIAQDQSLQRKG